MSILAVVIAALTLAPVGLAERPQSSPAGWKIAVSPQYHGRYRDVERASASATLPARNSSSERAWVGASSVALSELSRIGSVADRGLYRSIYRDDAISPRGNSAVPTSFVANVTADAFAAATSRRTSGYIGAPISAMGCATDPAASGQCAPVLGSPTTIARELERSRLMLRIGGALGFAYVAFLFLWFWATRMRPGPARSAGV